MSKYGLVLGPLLIAAAPAFVGAQAVGDEFQVNTYTTGGQRSASVSTDAGGNFVVVWEDSGQDGSSNGVFGQRFDAAGTLLGGEFQVNTETNNSQSQASVAMSDAGGFVVVWTSHGQDYYGGGAGGVFGQRYDANGQPQGGEFQVNSHQDYYAYLPPSGSYNQDEAATAMDANGNFVVVWRSDGQDGDGPGVFGQLFAAGGSAIGYEFQVNTYTTGGQRAPAVDMDAAGNFVVVWQSSVQDGSGYGVFGQRFDDTGSAVGGEFLVNGVTTGNQLNPSVAADASGNFVVVWQGSEPTGRRFNSAGDAQGDDFQVNTNTTGNQNTPEVAMDADGDFVVLWEDDFDQDGDGEGVFGQRFDTAGTPLDGEFQVNEYTTGDQYRVALGMNPGGDFVAVWVSEFQDGDGSGLFGRSFQAVTKLAIDDVWINEPLRGQATATFTVSLSGPSTRVVRVTCTTADGTATGGPDYIPVTRTLAFRPGTTTATITVRVRADRVIDPAETFFVDLSDPIGAVIADGQGLGTIN